MSKISNIALVLAALYHVSHIKAHHDSADAVYRSCVNATCDGMNDGDYQSCKGCCVYTTCVKGVLYDDRPCVGGTMWDESYKSCQLESATCKQTCITSCDNLPDGDYNSCLSCAVYATCVFGRIYDNRPCPADLLFDSNSMRCAKVSPTCC